MKKVLTTTFILFSLMLSLGLHAQDRPFITTWKTDNPGSSEDNQITIPTNGSGYNYDIYWEDVSDAAINGTLTGLTGKVTIDFPAIGTYRVEISGSFPKLYFNNSGDRLKILSVEQWGTIHWTSLFRAFYGCENIIIPAQDAPDLSSVTDLRAMFTMAGSFNDPIGHWDVSNVTNMSSMFSYTNSFNQDISDWDVGKVTDMTSMFSGASSFNQDLGSWDVSSVKNMSYMFYNATSFNQDIKGWNISVVTNMESMFRGALAFNQNLSNWNVGNVESMKEMFLGASSFNGSLDGWNVSKVTSMSKMFSGASSFNQNIGGWDVGKVTNMSWMFAGASSFNQDIGDWNTNNVRNMSGMFNRATLFNKGIGSWNLTGVNSMAEMFQGALSFNQNIGSWDVSGITDMSNLFQGAASFNGDIDNWNVSNVTDMTSMFEGAFSFNQDLNQWDVRKVTSMDRMFFDANSFNGDISAWDLSSVTTMVSMFENAWSFNKDLSGWDISGVADLSRVFFEARSFNQYIGAWDLSNVTNVSSLFEGASAFNQDISDWDLSRMKTMNSLFRGASSFNQDIGEWDVSEVTDMYSIFYKASSFNQDISYWDIRKVRNMNYALYESAISQENYDQLLFRWSSLPSVQRNVNFIGSGQTYCLGENARQMLIDEYDWVISGDEKHCDEMSFPGRSGSVALQIGGEAFLGLGRNDSIYFGDWLNISSDLDSVADFPGVARASAVAFVIDSLAYVGLGVDEAGNYLLDFYSYSPAQDLWVPIADFGGGARTNAVAFSVAQQGYVGTGKNSEGEQSDFWRYDPLTNVWTELPHWGSDKRQGAFSFVIDDKAYVGGGYYFDDFQFQLSDIREFDPTTETWTEKIFADGLNLSVNDAAAFSLYGKGYIAYGNKSNLIKYDPRSNTIQNLGDYFKLGTNRTDPIAYTVGDFAYFGLGYYGSSSTEYADDFDVYYGANAFPSDISLSANSIVENNEPGALIGVLSSVDADADDSPVYKLIGGEAREAFYISNDTLYTAKSLDYEATSTFSITIQVKDTRAGSFKKVFSISVQNIAEVPTMIQLHRNTIKEDDYNTVFVARLITNGDNGPFSYEIKEGDGNNDVDNDRFQTDDHSQLFMINPNFDEKAEYVVNIEVTDQAGVSYSQPLTVFLENVPEWPVDILISSGFVDESEEEESVELVGILDAKGDDPLIFSLIDGGGTNDADNDRFEIRNDSLFIINPNHEEQELFSLYAQVTDADGDTYEKAFTVTVNDVNEAPYEMEMVFEDVPWGIQLAGNTLFGTLHTDDPDSSEVFTYTLEENQDLFYVNGSAELRLKKSILIKRSEGLEFVVRSTDKGGLFVIRVFEYNNGNLVLSAPVAQLEIFPNPFEQVVHLRSDHPGHVQVYSITGALITEQALSSGDNSIDLGAHPAGVYILRMHQGEVIVDHKVIKR